MPRTPVHRTDNPASRGITAAAYAVPLCVLPSALWRLYHLATADPVAPACRRMGAIEPWYVASLSVVSLGAALLAIGLVRPWGQVFPRWIPRLGGRPVPVAAAVVPATVGVVLLCAAIGHGLLNGVFDYYRPTIPPACPPPPDQGPYGWVVVAAYAPLLLWAPLLALVTRDYHRRRQPIRAFSARSTSSSVE